MPNIRDKRRPPYLGLEPDNYPGKPQATDEDDPEVERGAPQVPPGTALRRPPSMPPGAPAALVPSGVPASLPLTPIQARANALRRLLARRRGQ